MERLSRIKVKKPPDWAERARQLRAEQRENLSQEGFARLVGVSTSEVRRWEQGRRAPTPAQAIALGKIAGPPECWYWWEMAGLSREDVGAAPDVRLRAGQARREGKRSMRIAEETRAVLATALETILERAPSAVIEEISQLLTDRAGKYGEER